MASLYHPILDYSVLHVSHLSLYSIRNLTGYFRLFVTVLTFVLVGIASPDIDKQAQQLSLWATFLGVTSTLLATFQYLPQIFHTFRHKLVGALSIPMMLIQTPGAILMVLSIALRYVFIDGHATCTLIRAYQTWDKLDK